jgi:hypothetical protein
LHFIRRRWVRRVFIGNELPLYGLDAHPGKPAESNNICTNFGAALSRQRALALADLPLLRLLLAIVICRYINVVYA